MKFLSILAFYILLLCSSAHNVRCLRESSYDSSKKNKFREREATDDNLPLPTLDEDALLNTKCPQNVELRWQTEVSSSIYATPLIADINSDGKLEIVVPSFVHYLEVLEGSDGDKMPGWPAFHKSTVHASPLLYDIDKDGIREVALATYNGEVIFFRVSGYLMQDRLEVPRIRVHKDWYVGLGKDHADRAHPDVHDDVLIQEAITIKLYPTLREMLKKQSPMSPFRQMEFLNIKFQAMHLIQNRYLMPLRMVVSNLLQNTMTKQELQSSFPSIQPLNCIMKL